MWSLITPVFYKSKFLSIIKDNSIWIGIRWNLTYPKWTNTNNACQIKPWTWQIWQAPPPNTSDVLPHKICEQTHSHNSSYKHQFIELSSFPCTTYIWSTACSPRLFTTCLRNLPSIFYIITLKILACRLVSVQKLDHRLLRYSNIVREVEQMLICMTTPA